MAAQISRLRGKYRDDVVPALMKRFGYKNPMAVPKISKVVVNIGLGEASQSCRIRPTVQELLVKALHLDGPTLRTLSKVQGNLRWAGALIQGGRPVGQAARNRFSYDRRVRRGLGGDVANQAAFAIPESRIPRSQELEMGSNALDRSDLFVREHLASRALGIRLQNFDR